MADFLSLGITPKRAARGRAPPGPAPIAGPWHVNVKARRGLGDADLALDAQVETAILKNLFPRAAAPADSREKRVQPDLSPTNVNVKVRGTIRGARRSIRPLSLYPGWSVSIRAGERICMRWGAYLYALGSI